MLADVLAEPYRTATTRTEVNRRTVKTRVARIGILRTHARFLFRFTNASYEARSFGRKAVISSFVNGTGVMSVNRASKSVIVSFGLGIPRGMFFRRNPYRGYRP